MQGSFEHVTPQELQVRQGGGCLSVFGLPFLGAGVFLLLTMFGVIPMRGDNEMTFAAGLVLGTLFTAVGSGLVFGRSWTTIDLTQRLVVKQWGLLVPMHEQTFPLGQYTAVTLEFAEGDSDTADKYPVGLKARPGSGADLPLSSFTAYGEARAYAAAVAKHLQLDIEDASTDHPVRLSHSEADRSLQHKLTLERAKEKPAMRPSGARSEVSREDGAVRIEIPNSRLHPVVFAGAVIPLAMAMFVLRPFDEFFRSSKTPDVVAWVFLGFILFGFGLFPAMTILHAYLKSRRGATILLVSSRHLRIQNRGVFKTRQTASFEAADILDIDFSTRESALASAQRAAEQKGLQSGRYTSESISSHSERVASSLSRFIKSGGLTVKTRQGLTTVAKGLADDEVRYLHGVVRQALRG